MIDNPELELADPSELPSLCPVLDAYLELMDDTEAPTLYHRWSFLAGVSALLNRRTKISMPTGDIYPNLYVILLGPPAARKSTAIRLASELIEKAGYTKFANGSTTPQKFLDDLYQGFDSLETHSQYDADGEIELDLSAQGQIVDHRTTKVSDVFINEGELQDFFGNGGSVFVSTITTLFDNLPHYDDRVKGGRSNRIIKPTVTMLGGATAATFRKTFPTDVAEQGLLSRFLLIHGAGPRQKCFMPSPFKPKLVTDIVEVLQYIYNSPDIPASLQFTPEAFEYSKLLYESAPDEIADPRFLYYNGRRNTHYFKLCMVITILNSHSQITESDCILANTILSYTEKFMPKALGEFGLDKQAEHTELILAIIRNGSSSGITLNELLDQALAIVPNATELFSYIIRLQNTGRIDKITKDGAVYYITIDRIVNSKSKMVNYSLLKEFRENPTFDTGHVVDASALAEYQMSLEFQELVDLHKKATKAAKGIRGPGRPKKADTKLEIL